MPLLLGLLIILLIVFNPGVFNRIFTSCKPLIYGLIIAYLLDPLVMFFVRKLRVRRVQGIFLSCLILIGIVGVLIYKILPQIAENINNITSFIMEGNIDVEEIIRGIRDKIDNEYVEYITDYILYAGVSVRNILNKILLYMYHRLMSLISNLGSGMFTMVISFIISIYMLVEKEDLLLGGRKLIHAYFEEKRARNILKGFSQGNKIFKSYINGKILDSTLVGIICVIAFYVAKVPYAPLMGALIGFFNIIPYFGPIIGSLPVVVVSFLLDPPKALTAILIIIIVQQIDANFLDPKIVGSHVGVSPFWIIVSVTLGGNLFGIPGMIIGVPIVVLIKTIIEESIEMRLIEKRKN